MASISYKEIEEKLKKLKDNPTSANEIGYILLDAFGMTKTSVERVRSGKMNLAHYEDGILVKKQLAYRAATSQKLSDTLEEMKADSKLLKQSPRILAVSDGTTLLAYDPKEDETYENKVAKLWLDFQFFYPLAGVEKYRGVSENPADVKAAEKMAKLYDEIRRFNDIASGEQVHDLNIFMTRLLFCYFAEDTGIFETNLFTSSVKRFTHDDGSDLSDYLDGCFNVMDQDIRVGVPSALAQFPYVNGGLFRKRIAIPKMGYRARNIILECGELSWSEINPDIFGSMIQAVVSPDMRAGLGMHYTSVPNIMKLIGPLFLNDLEEAFQVAKDSEKKLKALLLRISKMKFFDPACGSGNFLIIAYKELRNLEIRIWKQIREVTGQAIIPFVNIQLHQFYGIELDDFCHETAILSLWLAEHQMNNLFRKEFDVKIQALPLRPSGNIVCANACRIDWEDVCPHTKDEEVFIMGNPPYLGVAVQTSAHKSDMELVFSGVENYKKLDYIACWLYLGAHYIKDSRSICAFVSTNSICQGEMVDPLWTPLLSLNMNIKFVHKSFKWANNAKNQAGVYCIIIGIQNYKYASNAIIYSESSKIIVNNINPYLIPGENTIVKNRQSSISLFPSIIRGCMPYDGGNLILTSVDVNDLVGQFPNTNKYIKKLIGSADFINGNVRYCLWIPDNELETALLCPIIQKRVNKTREMRLSSPDSGARKLALKPHQFREFNECDNNTLIIPSTSSERREYIPMGFADTNTVITNSNYSVSNATLTLFGIVTSKMQMIWMKAIGGRLKSDYRYTSLVYNTFPFPEISEEKKKEIEEAAEEVLCVRAEHSEKTLAEMYDPDKMPADLRAAHHTLDLIVESCYRKELFTSDEERLEHLFKLYEKMTQKS